MIRTGLVIILLAIAAFVSLQFIGAGQPAKQAGPSTPQGSDTYMFNAMVYKMDAHGTPLYRMTVGKTLHFPDDSTRLHSIHLLYYQKHGNPWILSADRGRLPPGQKSILLHGDLRIQQNRSDGQITLKTSRARVTPGKSRARTTAAVSVNGPGWQLDARGMTVHFNTKQISFNHDVRTTYTP